MSGDYLDVWIMLTMGLMGFVFERWRIPLGPIVLGLIMGAQLEHRFLQCLTASSDPTAFLSRPIALGLALACAALWIAPLLRRGDRTAADLP